MASDACGAARAAGLRSGVIAPAGGGVLGTAAPAALVDHLRACRQVRTDATEKFVRAPLERRAHAQVI